jgi:hypothetical protein
MSNWDSDRPSVEGATTDESRSVPDVGPPPRSTDESNGDDVVADLVAHREDLGIVIHELSVAVPSIIPSVVGLLLSTLMLVAAVALLVMPYLETRLPSVLSTIASFFVVVAATTCYLAFRRFAADFERRRLYWAVIRRATFVSDVAQRVLTEIGIEAVMENPTR